MAVVLMPFAFAANGYTVVDLEIGDERDFGSATDGLVDAGFISVEDTDSPVVEAVAIEEASIPVAAATPPKKTSQRRR